MRTKFPEKSEKRYCRDCGRELEKSNWIRCERCWKKLAILYKDSDPVSDVKIHVELP